MSKVNEDIVRDIKVLFEDGASYSDIKLLINSIYNVSVSDDTIRYYCVRKDKPKFTEVEKLSVDGVSKKLFISDLHIPFNRDDVLDIVNKHKDEIDEIILNGDIVDCAEISSFEGLGKPSLTEEMVEAYRILQEIDILTPNIPKKMNFGNHEMRWKRYLAKTNTVLNELHSDNILQEICGGFTIHDHRYNTETIYNPLVNYTVIDSWWQIVNDVLVCHPISFSKIKGRTATLAVDYFIQQGEKFNVVLVGHTHQRQMVNYYDKIAIEQGCLCLPMEYSTSGKLTYSPQGAGYFLGTFKNGELDINESRTYYLK